jgi:hypothetical protein
MGSLSAYEARARQLSLADLRFAISDIQATMRCWPDRDPCEPYMAKLYAEFDAYTVEVAKRERRNAGTPRHSEARYGAHGGA